MHFKGFKLIISVTHSDGGMSRSLAKVRLGGCDGLLLNASVVAQHAHERLVGAPGTSSSAARDDGDV